MEIGETNNLLPFNVQSDGEKLVFHPNSRTVQETTFLALTFRVLDQWLDPSNTNFPQFI